MGPIIILGQARPCLQPEFYGQYIGADLTTPTHEQLFHSLLDNYGLLPTTRRPHLQRVFAAWGCTYQKIFKP